MSEHELPRAFPTDIDESNGCLRNVVIPHLLRAFPEMELAIITEKGDATGRLLDREAGIDFILRRRGHYLLALASRIQYEPWVFRTFTVRSRRANGTETEYAKLRRAFSHDFALRPFWLLQAYLDAEKKAVRQLFLCRGDRFFAYLCDNRPHRFQPVQGGNEMIVVEVADLLSHGVEVTEVTESADVRHLVATEGRYSLARL